MTFQQATPAIILSTFLFIAFAANFAVGQTTAFTYQGKLIDSSQPANGTYEMEFRLFNDPQVGAGGQQGATITLPSVQAVGGVFTTSLDFGPEVFETGNNLYLEISLRPAGSQVAFTTLTPRQAMTSAPYAIRSKTAGIADNSANLGSIPASSYVLTGDNRLSDARTPTPGSDDYIQNAMNAQVSANFNIGGTGTANIINAKTQFNINGSRIISTGNSGTNNLFVGINAGEQNGGGNNNSAFGFNSGRFLTTGVSNSFFGVGSGFSVGVGNFNSFFGHLSGSNVLAGSNNTFFGYATGFNSVGNANTFFGSSSGMSNLGGSNNTLLGANTDVTIGNLSFATAIGSGAVVGNSNSIVIGRSSGDDAVFVPGDLTVNGTLNAKLPAGSGNYIQNGISVQASSNFNISGNGTVGGTLGANLVNSSTQYNIAGQRILSNGGTSNMFVGTTTGAALTTGADNAFFGANSGDSTTTGSLNSFFGSSAGQANVSGGNNSFVG